MAIDYFTKWVEAEPLAHITERNVKSFVRNFVIFQFRIQVKSFAFPLGKGKEVYDAEAHAALKGIQAAISLPSARFANDIWLFIDNVKVARRLFTKTNSISSQYIFLDALEVLKQWKSRSRLPHIREGNINIRWVPSHAGIEGNNLADVEAKKGAALPFLNSQTKFSIASLNKWMSTQMSQAREKWWNDHMPRTYFGLGINTAPPFPKELLLRRKTLGQVIAARTGHGDFAAYHTRFKHELANNYCRCGSAKTPTHFLYCRIVRRRGGQPEGPINLLIPTLLGTSEGALILTKWLDHSQY